MVGAIGKGMKTTNDKATETKTTKCYCAECDRAGGSSPFCPRKMTETERRAAYGLDRPMGKGTAKPRA